jgi:hypothetical protein
MARNIDYAKRDFASLRDEQWNFLKRYYPEVIQNSNDASIMSVYVDLLAAISDNLHFNIDRSLQEGFSDFAQERKSIFHLASTFGVKLPAASASVSFCEFSINVPVFGDAEDTRYLPIIKAGTQVIGGGNIFELAYDINFNDTTDKFGFVDRYKTPIYNNGNISGYRIVKSGVVINGVTKIFSQEFSTLNVKPFYQITLPENNVISVESVIHKDGVGFTTNPTYDEFDNSINKWYEMGSLVEDQVFIEDTSTQPDSNGYYSGVYTKVDNRFIKEYTPNGYCVLTFGNTVDRSYDLLDDFLDNQKVALKSFLNNGLGNSPYANTTMYVKYRSGGGQNTNVAVGAIDRFGDKIIKINGPDTNINNLVSNSLNVRNITPAIGGSDLPSVEEIKKYISYNFAAQNRAVTLNDYRALIMSMPSKFGSPSDYSVSQNRNIVEISLLGYDDDGNLSSQVSTTMMENLSRYLSYYRSINDYVLIQPGEIIDVSVEIDVLTQDSNQLDISSKIISEVTALMNASNMPMGTNFQTGKIYKAVSNVFGVLSVKSIKFFNKTGTPYSDTETTQRFIDEETKEIDTTSGFLFVKSNQRLNLKFPEDDIVIKMTISNPRTV